jgi:NB-ARC domain/APAF-1 helical domain
MSQYQENKDNAHGKQVEVKDYATANVADTIHFNNYQSSRPPRGIPFQALALPKDYVDRPEIRQKIKSMLIDCSVSRPGTLVVSAIYGLGGVGKSVMAAALAHDAEVQKVCADGVLWVTLGQNPDLLSSLYGWVQKLGDYDFKPTNVDSASSHLRSLLHDKKMLLVVDDAWHTDHVVPFQVGGDGCRVLVTTREADVLDADRIDMDVMSEAEALELSLSKAQVKSLTIEDEQQAKKLIAVVGGLPLAVDLAGAQIADGMRWSELLEDLEAEIAYLEALDRPNFEGVMDEKTRKRLSLKASLNLSLKLLSNEQLQQFAWLGVLPEDVAIQPKMAATLWSISLKKAGAVLRTFRAKALLLSGVQWVGQESSYRIHDLMHDLARGLLTGEGEIEIPGLGLQWSDAHGALLDRYRQQVTDNLWHTLPDDGYIYSYLTWHMEKATRFNELHGLFQEVTTDGRNGWYERCDFLGMNAKFVNDLRRAWQLAEKMYEEDKRESINLQIRYALIFSTLNSLASNIPAKLIAALVKNKKYSTAQGLAYAKQAQRSSKCSEILQELAAFLPHILLSEALEIACDIHEESDRANALTGLAAYLPENMLPHALEVASSIQDEFDRAKALTGLAAYLPENMLSHALEVASSIQDESDRAKALTGLAAYLPEDMLSHALEVAFSIQDEFDRASALSGLATHLPETMLSRALEVTSSIQNESYQAKVLIDLVANRPKNFLLDVLKIVRSIHSKSNRANVMIELSTHLPEITSEALNEAHEIEDMFDRFDAMNKLETHLLNMENVVLVEEMNEYHRDDKSCESRYSILCEVEAARSIQNDADRAYVLSKLAAYAPEDILLEISKLAYEIQHEYYRADAIIGLVTHLPKKYFSEALDVTFGIRNVFFRGRVLREFAAHLPENMISKALLIARVIQDKYSQALALSGLIAHLPEIISETLEIAHEIHDKSDQVDILSQLVTYLPEIISEALAIAHEIQHEYSRIKALNKLAIHMSENIILEAFEALCKIYDEHSLAVALSGLASHLPQNIFLEALSLARSIQNESDRARVLTKLVPQMPEIIPEVLSLALSIQNKSDRAYLLSELADYLPKNLFLEALSLARNLQNEFDQAMVLTKLASQVPEVISEVLRLVLSIQNESDQTRLLINLIPNLSEDFLLEALDIVRGFQSEFHRASVFSAAIHQINLKFFDFPLWSEMLQTLAHRDRSQLLEDIPKLAPAIIHLSDRSTLNLVVQAIREVCQQWP